MKKRPMMFLAALILTLVGAVAALAQDDAEVRKELDGQYKRLAEAHDRKDLKSIASLKTLDFHAIFPDGRVGDVRVMEQYTKQFIESNQPPFNIRNTIQTLAVSENKLIAVAEVFQEASRTRELAGKVRKVDTSAIQRETWVKTLEGWKLKSVDSVRDQKRFVDGKRVDPTKPYDPNAPPYNPDDTQQASEAEQEIRKLERAWLDAYEQHDTKAMDAIVAGDFVITFTDGSMQTKPQILDAIKTPRNPASASLKFYTEDVKARVYDNTVVLMGRVITEYQREGKTVRDQSRYTDTYLRRQGRWQVVASHLSNVTVPPR